MSNPSLWPRTSINRGGFLPSDVAALICWYDASDLATITESSGDVSQWDDKSGEGNHLVQATGVNQPTTGADTQNGKNVITFNDASEYLHVDSFVGGSLSQPNTIFITLLPDSDTAALHTYIDGDTSGQRQLIDQLTTTGNYRIFAGNSTPSSTVRNTSFTQLTAVFNGASSSLRENASEIHTGNVGSNPVDGINVNANVNEALGGTIRVGEILIYDAEITGTDLTSIEQYLVNRWGT